MGSFLSMSIRRHMILLIIVMSVVPIGIIINSAFEQGQRDLKEATLLIERLSDEVSNDQNVLVLGAQQLLTTLALVPSVQTRDAKAVNSLLAELGKKNPQISNILLMDKSGVVWASAMPVRGVITADDRRYFRKAMETGTFSSGEYTVGRVLGKPAITFGYPVKDSSGKIQHVAAASFTLDKYSELLKMKKLPASTSLVLTDHRGIILFDATAPQFTGKQDKQHLFRRMAEGPERGTFDAVGITGIHRYFAYQKVRLNTEQTPYMYIRTGVPVAAVLAKTRSSVLVDLGLLSSITLLAFAFAVYISKRGILDKINALRDATQKVAGGDLEARVSQHVAGGELGELGCAFDDMACRLADCAVERRQAEKALWENEEKYRSLIEATGTGYVIIDTNGVVFDANLNYAELCGRSSASEVIGHSVMEWTAEHDRERSVEAIRNCVDRGGVNHIEVDYINERGGVLPVEINANLLQTSEGIRVITLCRDITERRQADDALRDSEKTLRLVMDSMPAGVWWVDTHGKLEYLNHCFVEQFGYTIDDIPTIHDWFWRAYPDPASREAYVSARNAAVAEALEKGSPIPPRESKVTTKDGRVRHVIINNHAGKDRTLAIFTDITEHKFISEQLLRIQKLESLGVLAGGIAHDFNNILTGILGNISIAKMMLNEDHKSYKMLDSAENASRRAAGLASQLMTFAKGGQPIKTAMMVQRLIEDCVSLTLTGTNVKAVVEIPKPLRPIEADEGQLSQAFGNLIINAVHAMIGGGVLTIRGENATIDVFNGQGLAAGEYVRLTFADQGCGIPEENLTKIFDPYFTTKTEGTGLGLTSTYSIVCKHGGHIFVESTVGEGSTFTIYLPSLQERMPENHRHEEIVSPHRGGSILVMDDETMILDLASEMLTHLGFEVSTCKSGEEAVTLYREARERGAPFSVVIMDLTIPGGMGGAEAAKIILSYDSKARLIVSSGYSNDPIMAEHKKYGFSGAAVKPYQVGNMLQLLNAVL